MRYRVKSVPTSRVLGKSVELTLQANTTPPAAAADVAAAPCVPAIAALVWVDPTTAAETDTAVLLIRNVTTEFGPGQFLSHNVPINDWNFHAKLVATVCDDCVVNWVVSWADDEGGSSGPPGYHFNAAGGAVFPRTTAAGSQLTHLPGLLSLHAELVCAGHPTITSPTIYAVVTGEGAS